jgi:tetratricopeptide (TPR) repeat protein
LAKTMGKAASFCIFAAVVAAGAGPFHPAWASPATPAMIAEVLAALDKGDAQHAQNMADDALRDDGVGASERGCLLLYRGLAWELLGAHAAAMQDFTDALNIRTLPADAREQALLQRGFLRDGLGRLDEALRDYSAVVALKGTSFVTALNNRANIYRRQNRLADAHRDYLAALSAGSAKPQYSYFGLGQIAEAQHDAAAARGFYAKAASADPDYAAAAQRLAALGGPLDGAIPERGEKIILRSPSFRHAVKIAQASPDDGGQIAPPVPHDATVAVTLHPRHANAAQALRFTPVAATALRPALDQPPVHFGVRLAVAVQLGAWRSAVEADAGWSKAKLQAGGTLDGLQPRIVSVDLPGKGRYFRLRVSPASDQSAADVCAGLLVKGIACVPVRD